MATPMGLSGGNQWGRQFCPMLPGGYATEEICRSFQAEEPTQTMKFTHDTVSINQIAMLIGQIISIAYFCRLCKPNRVDLIVLG